MFTKRIEGISIAFILHDKNVDEKSVNIVVDTIKKLVETIETRGIDYLEVHLYSDRSSAESFIALEEKRIGVFVSAGFPIMYEAWTGIPRIHLSLQEWINLDSGDREALLAHELIHSILHSAPEYYMVEIDENTNESIVSAYIAALVLKDLEVHKLMADLGLKEYLDNLDSYWKKIIDRKCPSSLEEFIDYLKASTIWIVGERTLESIISCKYMLELIKELDKIRRGNKRPWFYVKDFRDRVRKVLLEFHVSR